MPQEPVVVQVENLDVRGVEPYRTLRRQESHLREGIFVAEGEKVVRRLLASGMRIRSMLLTPEWKEALFGEGPVAAPDATFIPGASVFVAPRRLLEAIVGFSLHQGLMAVAETPREMSEEEVTAAVGASSIFVALDDLVNAENVGLVVRNCAAFGVDTLICGETSSSPYLRRAVRASMGTVFGLPVHPSPDLAATLRTLAARAGMAAVAADPSATESLHDADLSGPLCLVLGHEGTGIRPGVLAACGRRISIPMWRGTDSLNVSSACAVFLAEARRQRERGDLSAGRSAPAG